jgi:hypothetical protein
LLAPYVGGEDVRMYFGKRQFAIVTMPYDAVTATLHYYKTNAGENDPNCFRHPVLRMGVVSRRAFCVSTELWSSRRS